MTVRAEKAKQEREKGYTFEEASRVLNAALVAPPKRLSKDQAAARRWLPWLCAYTGARINELTILDAADVQQRRVPGAEPIWVLHLRAETTKTLGYRDVPLHPHLLEMGFLRFVQAIGAGPLFYDPARARKASAAHPLHMKTAERLARWVREDVGIKDARIDPNHGWRHRFKTISRAAGLVPEIRDHIQGHALRTEGEGYGDFWPQVSLREISKLPRHDVGQPLRLSQADLSSAEPGLRKAACRR